MSDIGLRLETGPSRPQPRSPGRITGKMQSGRLWEILWHGRSVRWQILAAFIMINVVAAFCAAALILFNAKRSVELEIGAATDVAHRFVRASIAQLKETLPSDLFLEDLIIPLGKQRHVRIVVATVNNRPIWLSQPAADPANFERPHPPQWFSGLIEAEQITHEVPVISDGKHIGTVRVIGVSDDEIAEIWADLSSLSLIALAVNAFIIGLLYLALGRLLKPLSAVASGLNELEHGHLQHRLAAPKLRELADIVHHFNGLAASLGAAKDDNLRLNRRLISAQEDERKQLAMELHDELGPCLFGLKANMASAQRLASELEGGVREKLNERLQTLTEISERIQLLNRRMLSRLRPMALGQLQLADVLNGLICEFERHDTGLRFIREIKLSAHGYGDFLDLTAYRCLQEALTNAVKHSGAQIIDIEINEFAGAEGPALRLTIKDDGIGIADGQPLGMGLSGMAERVKALGGCYRISRRPEGGTQLAITIPLEVKDSLSAAQLNSQEATS